MTTLGLNAGLAAGSNLLGIRLDPFAGYNFLVEIEGIVAGGFSKVRGLETEIEVFEYREGGLNEYLHQLPGPSRHPSRLTLEHGISFIDGLWSWHQDTLAGTVARKNLTVYLLEHGGLGVPTPAVWWDVEGAWPVRWSGPELVADQSAVAFETVELAYHGISKPLASRAAAAVTTAI